MRLTAETANRSEARGYVRTLDEGAFAKLVERLSGIIREKRDRRRPDNTTVEWTMKDLILPLLEGLGWDKRSDILFEYGPKGNDGRPALILKCRAPVGIAIRPLHERPPQDVQHPQIRYGLRQCKAKKLPNFIWTNGDSWQFFSLALSNSPIYQVSLSKMDKDLSLPGRLLIIKKDLFISDPDRFSKTVIKNTILMSLSNTWTAILKDHTKEVLQVFRKGLQCVDIRDEEILRFLKTLNAEYMSHKTGSSISFKPEYFFPQAGSSVSFESEALLSQAKSPNSVLMSNNWDRLISSYESPYRLARWFFQTSYYRRLGEYLISEDYKPWSKDSTWRHLGLSNGINEEKKVRHAVVLFQEWGFIKETDADEYCRVEGCSPYLRKLLEDATSH